MQTMDTFSEVVRDVAGRWLPLPIIKQSLEVLGQKAEQPLAEIPHERKLQLVAQFVRGLRNIGVAQAAQIQHLLYVALGAAPTERREVIVKDAISLIAVRNHVQQLGAALGVPWSESMQVQSAISDVARFVATAGGGRIETEALNDGRVHFSVWTNTALGPISIASPPPWLVGAAALTAAFRVRPWHGPEGSGTHIELWIPMAAAMVA
jgi:hypothetical protein